MRLCPKCGKKIREARCPDDGTATLVLAQNPDAKLTEGTEVNGRYRIDKIIGQGGFGAVYKAKNLATDQDIAIKLLAVSLDSDDSDMIQRFFAEAQVTASLKHPNTIRVFDFGQTEGGALYIAMELLSGRPLNEELRERVSVGKVFSEDEIITIGSQVLRSLAEAHLANLVHRDLKPHNIFLHEVEGDDSVVKVLDFGIAKRLGTNMTGTGKAFGTPTYMSPEQAQNKAVDRRSDIYSLGCVLYQLAAGRPPFDGENPLAVLLAHVAEPPPSLRDTARTPLSDRFLKVVDRALAKSADDRFATAIEMRQALELCRGADRSATATAREAAAPAMASAADFIDEATSGCDAAQAPSRTVAYQIPTTPARGAAPVQPPALGPAIPPPPAGKGPESSAVMAPVAPTAVATTAPARRPSDAAIAQQDAAPLPRKRNKGALLLVGGGLAIVAIVAAVVLGGAKAEPPVDAKPGEGPDVKAVAALQPAAGSEPRAPVAEPTVAAPEPKAVNNVPAGPLDIEVVSDPAGADVLLAGKVVGQTPYKVRVQGDEPVAATLHAEGYADKDFDIGRGNYPQFKANLRKLDEVEASAEAAKKSAGKSKGGGKKGGSGERTKGSDDNILNERLE